MCEIGLFLAHQSRRLTRGAYSIARLWCPSSLSVVHNVEQLYLQGQLANFSQILSVASLSNLQVTRTGIKSWMSLNLDRVGLFTTELFALERSH